MRGAQNQEHVQSAQMLLNSSRQEMGSNHHMTKESEITSDLKEVNSRN